MRCRIPAWLAGALAVLSLVAAGQTPIPPPPNEPVTDTAKFMSPGAVTQLNVRLRAYEAETQHQLLVWIGTTTGEESIERFANRAFESWRVGRKGIDNGLVLFIMASDRKLRFEVGYGLEGDVPDVIAYRIINDIMVPRIRAGDNDGAVTAGMEAIAARIGSPGLPGARTAAPIPRGRVFTLGQLVFFGIVGIILLILLITNPSLAILLLSSQVGGRRHRHGGWGGGGWGGGGWSGGGGGWSGGGGRSGGGGASGSW